MAVNVNMRWAEAVADELFRAGARHAVVCPGSRSAPLALAFARHPEMKTWSVVDERTAGFFALGIGQQSGRPAVVVATSGTAGAHFLPAAIESSMARVPLILITADRPPELHAFGAPQSIDQQRLFGGFAKAFLELGVPEGSNANFLHLRAAVSRAAWQAQNVPFGMVHLNAPFREPLSPSPDDKPLEGLSPLALEGRASNAPFLAMANASAAKDGLQSTLGELGDLIRKTERGVIVCGPRVAQDGLSPQLQSLSRATGYPIFAEAASGVRFRPGPPVVSLYDVMLRHPEFANAQKPDLVLRFGGGLTSKRLLEWLEMSSAQVVLFSDQGDVFDSSHQATQVIGGNAEQLTRSLVQSLGDRSSPGEAWRGRFLVAQSQAEAALDEAFAHQELLTEPSTANEVVQALPLGSQLFLGSSMPIRDVDAFAKGAGRELRVLCNRGVNGIDGNLSTALGAAAASGAPLCVLLGDLAFLHDLNGLLIARRYGIPLTVVIVNNDGGGIFSFLPVAKVGQHFEEFFATPHGLDLAHAAALFGARHVVPTSPASLREAVQKSLGKGLTLIEVRVDRQNNVAEHQALYARVQESLAQGWVGL